MDLAALLSLAQNNLWATAAAVFLATTLVLLVSSALSPRQPPLDLDSMSAGGDVGDITPDELAKHDGRDPFRPIYLAIKGTVYDVTPGRSFYGPGERRRRGGRERDNGRERESQKRKKKKSSSLVLSLSLTPLFFSLCSFFFFLLHSPPQQQEEATPRSPGRSAPARSPR